ncbi:putative HTH-type transcriptional regulator [compost metagenome]
MSTLQERLRQILDGPPKISQAALARACGIKPPSVHDWISGKTKSIEGQNLLLAAEFLRVTPKWLATGRGPMSKTSNQEPEASNVASALQPTRSFSYPEISWVQAGSAREAIDMGNVALCPQHTSDVWAGEDAFWLKVVGNSMSSTSGNSFPEGFLILVAPDIEPRPGQFVVARMIDTNEATFKQLIRDAGELYLKPLNPSYSTKAMDDTWEIVGTVVDGKMPKSVFL